MKFMKFTTAILAATIALSGAVEAKNYKLATNVGKLDSTGILLQKFADEVGERTEGRVKIKVFYGGTLGDQLDYFQQIQKGVIEIGLVSSATLENVIPEIGVINMPYMFRSKEEYEEVMTNPKIETMLYAGAEEKGFAMLGFISNGYRSIYSTKPIESIDDLKGMKLRTMSSQTFIDTIDAFGATATPMPYSDVFSALQQGIVDGGESGLGALWTAKFGEVAKYGLNTEQIRLTDTVVMSTTFRDELTPEDLTTVRSTFGEISRESIDFVDSLNAEMMQKAADELGVTYTTPDIGPYIQAVQPLYEKAMQDPAKAKLIEAIYALEDRKM